MDGRGYGDGLGRLVEVLLFVAGVGLVGLLAFVVYEVCR